MAKGSKRCNVLVVVVFRGFLATTTIEKNKATALEAVGFCFKSHKV